MAMLNRAKEVLLGFWQPLLLATLGISLVALIINKTGR